MTAETLYTRMYGGKRLHIVKGRHAGVYVAQCGALPGTQSNGYPSPGWYDAHAEPSPYFPICKACERLRAPQEGTR